MSKYRVLVTDSNKFLASFDSYNEAEEAAKQFGKQFINLWNDFLLFR